MQCVLMQYCTMHNFIFFRFYAVNKCNFMFSECPEYFFQSIELYTGVPRRHQNLARVFIIIQVTESG